jgi:hypothetical protein
MTTFDDTSDLQAIFIQNCLNRFEYLSTYGFELAGTTRDRYGSEVTYKNPTTGVKVSFEVRENEIFVYLIRLIDGEIPDYLHAPSNWFYLDNLVKPRSPRTNVPRKEADDWFTPEDVDNFLSVYAELLKEHGEDVLRGDFHVFSELERQVARPNPSSNTDDLELIRSDEEPSAQMDRLTTQIVEYYDTYFSELRRQLSRPDLFAEAVPAFLRGYKRVISVGAKDGLIVAHFPVELGMTLSAKDSGSALMRFPAQPDAGEDSYEFIQIPNVPVRVLVNDLSGGEDIEMELPLEGASWGVAGFNAPPQGVDMTIGELAWQAPWTRLVAADFRYLRWWENTERARREAREDVEPYVRGQEHHYSAYDEPSDDPTTLENTDEGRAEISDQDEVDEESEESSLGVVPSEGHFATVREQTSFSFD